MVLSCFSIINLKQLSIFIADNNVKQTKNHYNN